MGNVLYRLSTVHGVESAETSLSVVARVIESLVFVQRINRLHLVFSHGPREEVDVLRKAGFGGSLGHDGGASLDSPSEANLSCSFVVLLSNVNDSGHFRQDIILSSKSDFHVGGSAKVRVGHHLSARLLGESL